MTRADVFVRILHEVTGKPKSEVRALLDAVIAAQGAGNFFEELPDAEAEELMQSLRQEKEGILAWLEEGAMQVKRNAGTA